MIIVIKKKYNEGALTTKEKSILSKTRPSTLNYTLYMC